MRQVHVHHQFHAVGHGTFFTGMALDRLAPIFRWVYDCGSKRSTRTRAAIDAVALWGPWRHGLTVDLMAVSHFDDDHVNGLEQFLELYRVKWLALPYVGFRQLLAHAASLDGETPSSAATAGFALDPVGYLSARGLAERVEGILFVQGGRGDGASDGGQELPDPKPGAEPDGGRAEPGLRLSLEQALQEESFRGGASGPRVRMHDHGAPIRASGFPIEFVFFNTAVPGSTAGRTGLPIDRVRQEVAQILDRFGVLHPSKQPKRGWRDKLRACYVHHFGDSGPQRNNISLCVLVRPLLAGGAATQCALFRQPDRGPEVEVGTLGPRHALLLTGDLALNHSSIGEMRSHFRDWRWSELGVAQVPHHGSRHSWMDGNAKLFPGPQFVQCVPSDTGKPTLHPHPLVVKDLAGVQVHHADYRQSVVQAYHFHA